MHFEILFYYFKEKKWRNLVVVVCIIFLVLVFYLYGIPARVLRYSTLLSCTVFVVGMLPEYYFYYKKYIWNRRILEFEGQTKKSCANIQILPPYYLLML